MVVVVVVVVLAPKWNEQRKNEPGVSGARETSTDGFHLPGRRQEDQRKTVAVAAMDPCSVSKPHGKNEREGDTGARGHSNHGLHLPDKRQDHLGLSRLEERGLFMVCEEGSHRLGPPSKKSPKRGGIPPHPPSFGVGRESPGPRDEMGI